MKRGRDTPAYFEKFSKSLRGPSALLHVALLGALRGEAHTAAHLAAAFTGRRGVATDRGHLSVGLFEGIRSHRSHYSELDLDRDIATTRHRWRRALCKPA